jgi:hypothetical protein
MGEVMNKAEREALIKANAESRAALQADMKRRRQDRRQRELRGDEPFDPQPQHTPPTVLNRGQQQVRASYENARPVLDDQTMALWNGWLDERVAAIIGDVVDVIGEESGKVERTLRVDIEKMLNDMRSVMHREMNGYVKRKDREFSAEVDRLRQDVAYQVGAALGQVVDLPPMKRKA